MVSTILTVITREKKKKKGRLKPVNLEFKEIHSVFLMKQCETFKM